MHRPRSLVFSFANCGLAWQLLWWKSKLIANLLTSLNLYNSSRIGVLSFFYLTDWSALTNFYLLLLWSITSFQKLFGFFFLWSIACLLLRSENRALPQCNWAITFLVSVLQWWCVRISSWQTSLIVGIRHGNLYWLWYTCMLKTRVVREVSLFILQVASFYLFHLIRHIVKRRYSLQGSFVILNPDWRKILLSQTFKIWYSPNLLIFWGKLSVFYCATSMWLKMLNLSGCCVISCKTEIGLTGCVHVTLVVPINIQG